MNNPFSNFDLSELEFNPGETMNITKEDLLSNLPWLARNQASAPVATTNVANEVLPALAIFGAGLVVGAGLGLLFAPKAGRELRNEIADRATDLSHRIPNIRHNAVEEEAVASNK